MVKIILTIFSLLIISPPLLFSQEGISEDTVGGGTYEETITTDTGSYSAPVRFEDGQASDIEFPDYSDMSVYGIEDYGWKEAGIDSKGEPVTIDRQEDYEPEKASDYEPDLPPYQYQY